MLVNNIIDGEIYIKLMNYIFQKCDVFSLFRLEDYHAKSTKNSLDVILSTENYTVEDIMEKYSEEFLNEIYEKYKDNEQIFNKPRVFNSQQDEEIYKSSLTSHKIAILYGKQIEKNWLQSNKDSLIFTQKEYYYTDEDGVDYYNDIYYFKLTNKLKQEILEKKSIYDWLNIGSLEDICFYKPDGNCWLGSISHENLCWINCDSQEEFEYLKSIGIKFHKKQYEPLSSDDIFNFHSLMNSD